MGSEGRRCGWGTHQNKREERVVVDLDKLLVPSVLLLLLGLLVLGVVVAVLEDELEDVALDSWEWDGSLWWINLSCEVW